MQSIWRASNAVMFSAVPRYGTCVISTPSFSHSSSIARWLEVAMPEVP